MNYRTLKIFDCDKMPPEVRSCFYEIMGCNSRWSRWVVGATFGNLRYTYQVDQWLILNGSASYEEVLIEQSMPD